MRVFCPKAFLPKYSLEETGKTLDSNGPLKKRRVYSKLAWKSHANFLISFYLLASRPCPVRLINLTGLHLFP